MASLEQASKSGKQGEVRYLTPLDIETNEVKKYCRFAVYYRQLPQLARVKSLLPPLYLFGVYLY